MQRFTLVVLFTVFMTTLVVGQEWKGREDLPTDFPVPEKTDKSLFYIQRNKNIRTIVYDLNVEADGTLNPKDPIDFYWRERDGKRKELSWLEAWLAYGYRAKKKGDNEYQIKLRAHNERYLVLKEINQEWKIMIAINGEESYLTNIYAYADESGIIPDVKHVDIFGINIKTGEKVKERIFD